MEYFKFLKIGDDDLIRVYGRKIVGSLKDELDSFKLKRILEENDIYRILNINENDLPTLERLSNNDKKRLKFKIKEKKMFSSNIILNPYLNNDNDLNKEFTFYKSFIFNKLVDNVKIVDTKKKLDVKELLELQKEFIDLMDDYSRLNFPDKNLINIQRLEKIFNKIYTIEKNLNENFSFEKANPKSPYLFKSLNQLAQKTKISNENIQNVFEESQEKFNLIIGDFPFLSKKLVFNDIEIDENNIEFDSINLLLSSNIPIEISTNGVVDYAKIHTLFLENNVLLKNEKFFYFLRKMELEDDILSLTLIYYLLPYLNTNTLAKINVLIIITRIGSNNFTYSIKNSIIFDLKELANPLTWKHIKDKIINSIVNSLKNDDERYTDEKEVFKIFIKTIDFELYQKNSHVYVEGKKWYKDNDKNVYYDPGFEKSCLVNCVYRYFVEIGLTCENEFFKFCINLPNCLQFYLLTGDIIKSFEEISKIYKVNFLCFRNNTFINYNKYPNSITNEKYIYYVNLNHVSLIHQLPKQKRFILGECKVEKEDCCINVSWDLETFTDDKYVFGNQTPYCLCTYSENINFQKVFWGESCIKDFVNWISTFNENVLFWSFNGSRFDNQFLINDLLYKFGEIVEFVGTRLQKKQIRIGCLTFNDFNCFFPGSLNSVCKNFGIQGKEEFDISKINKTNYEKNSSDIIKYCIQDCRCLYECVEKFFTLLNKINLFKSINFDFKSIATNSSLSLKLVKGYLKSKGIKLYGSYGDILKLEKESYHGGVCLVFKKKLENCYCYDINSSYPAVLKKSLPIEIDRKFIFDADNYEIKNHDLIEFEYELENDTFSIFPEKTKDGSLIYVKSHPKAVHWGIELLFMKKNFKFIKLKIFNVIRYKKAKVFTDLIDHFYNLRLEEKKKENKNSTLIEMYKLVLNSIYGKFGQRFFLKEKLVRKNKIPNFFNDIKEIEIINDDFSNVIFKEDKDYYCQIGSLVRIASFVCARARVNLFKPIAIIGFEHLAYVDTDSLFIDCELPKEFIDNEKLGKFKLEYTAKNFIGVCPKVYGCFVNGVEKIKMKSCKLEKNGISQISIDELDKMSQDSNFKVKLQNLQFTRTLDNNVKISCIEKEIKNNFFKRIYIDNNSQLWNDVVSYENYMFSRLKIIKKSKCLDENAKIVRKLLKEEKIFIEEKHVFSLGDLINYFDKNKKILDIDFIPRDLHTEYDILKNFENILKHANVWFTWFLLTNKWKVSPIKFYHDNSLVGSEIEEFWRDELYNLNSFI